jgi:hypothetical protein
VLKTVVDGKTVLENVTQTNSLDERIDRAEQCLATLKLSLPTLIDKDDNKVNAAYAGWPDRFYVVGLDGKIAFKGGPGPGGFKPGEVEEWLKGNAKRVAAESDATQSPKR